MPNGMAMLLVLFTLLIALSPSYRMVCVFAVAFLFTTLALNQRLNERLPDSQNQTIHELSGMIGNLPERNSDVVRFVFLPDTKPANFPSRIRVYWYTNTMKGKSVSLPEVHAGERWRLQLELRTTRSRINFHGSDRERGLFAQGIGALGYVQTGQNVRLAGAAWYDLQHWR